MDEIADVYDVAIVGAGPAGSAAAIMLARFGYKTVLFDRDSFPRDKLCGEFLSGESWSYLEELNCADGIRHHSPPPISSMRFISARGTDANVKLPAAASGVSRRLLDHTLVQSAAKTGAEVFERHEVTSIGMNVEAHAELSVRRPDGGIRNLKARLVLGTYGRFSQIDRALGRASAPVNRKFNFVGLKLHHRLRGSAPELHSTGEVYAFRGGYCGICRVEGGLVNVCMLLQRQWLQGGAQWPEVITRLTAANPAFAARISALEACQEPVQTAAPVSLARKQLAVGNVFFAGDAAAMIAPLCGDGQAMALDSGIRFAKLVHEQWQPASRPLTGLATAWTSEWHQAYDARLNTARLLQFALLRPTISHSAISALRYLPAAGEWLARITRGPVAEVSRKIKGGGP
jgi:flavin-dependent dehydrogenase